MKDYSTPILPQRYLYHITGKKNRFSIEENGLSVNTANGKSLKYKNAVFAHNSSHLTLDWFPLCMDFYEWSYWDNFDFKTSFPKDEEAIKNAFDSYYDIWRIDTTLFKGNWFVDGVGEREFKGSFFRPTGLFVVTFESIPAHCIKRCSVELKEIEKQVDCVFLRCTSPIPIPIRA